MALYNKRVEAIAGEKVPVESPRQTSNAPFTLKFFKYLRNC